MTRALALAALLSTSGCSFVMTRRVDTVLDPTRPVDCVADARTPSADGLLGLVAAGTAGVLLFKCVSIYGEPTPDCHNGPAALAAGVALGFGASAWRGSGNVASCQRAQHLQEACAGGDQLACRTLSPGWTPPVPVQAPATPPSATAAP